MLKGLGEELGGEGLFLSAVCWYHLEDRVRAITLLEQLLVVRPGYSVDCYKLLAVCYYKALDCERSLEKVLP